jgi:eukaryotic-like serine/threonine-protein kinase
MSEPAASSDPHARQLEPGVVIAGKFRLEDVIGRGGMGSVWSARHVQLDMPVALKFMDPLGDTPDARLRFEREAKAAALIRTPHVVQIIDHGIDGDTPYIAMELLEGEDLGARLRRDRRLSLAATSRILSQIAKALRRAHEAGVIHRDLKPSNVFLARVDDEEVVKVLDFGVAKIRLAGAIESQATQAGVVFGSPSYMSPEQARGVRLLDHRTDLWSLSVILFRALTGEKPFAGDTIADLVVKLCIDPIPVASTINPGLPRDVDGFFERAFARDIEQRFPSAMAMAAELAAIAGETSPSLMSFAGLLPPRDFGLAVAPAPGVGPAAPVSAPAPAPVAAPAPAPAVAAAPVAFGPPPMPVAPRAVSMGQDPPTPVSGAHLPRPMLPSTSGPYIMATPMFGAPTAPFPAAGLPGAPFPPAGVPGVPFPAGASGAQPAAKSILDSQISARWVPDTPPASLIPSADPTGKSLASANAVPGRRVAVATGIGLGALVLVLLSVGLLRHRAQGPAGSPTGVAAAAASSAPARPEAAPPAPVVPVVAPTPPASVAVAPTASAEAPAAATADAPATASAAPPSASAAPPPAGADAPPPGWTEEPAGSADAPGASSARPAGKGGPGKVGKKRKPNFGY